MEQTKLICVTFTGNIKFHSGVQRLIKSCKQFDVVLQMAGKKTFSWREKVEATRDFLIKLRTFGNGSGWDGLVLVCDAFDVRFLCGAEEIVRKYHEMIPDADKILFSGERESSHQTEITSSSNDANVVYKNFSSCMILGKRQQLIRMLNEVILSMQHNISKNISVVGCRCGPPPKTLCDQWYMAQWASLNQEKVVIDVNCSIFWSTRGEHKKFTEKYAEAIRDDVTKTRRFLNRTTRTKPCVLHTPLPSTNN